MKTRSVKSCGGTLCKLGSWTAAAAAPSVATGPRPVQLCAHICRYPQLLLTPPEHAQAVGHWLASLGVQNVAEIHKAYPEVFALELATLESRAALLQDVGIIGPTFNKFMQKHGDSLRILSDDTVEVMQLVAAYWEVPLRSPEFLDALMSCSVRINFQNASSLSSWLQESSVHFGLQPEDVQRVLKRGTFIVRRKVWLDRAQQLEDNLSCSSDMVKSFVRQNPNLMQMKPSTIISCMKSLQVLGFSADQVRHMCTKQPTLTCSNWRSDLRVESWQFLKFVMQIDNATLAARPRWLCTKLDKVASWYTFLLYLQQLGALDSSTQLGGLYVLHKVFMLPELAFAAEHNPLASRAALRLAQNGHDEYNKAFQQRWLQRWKYLTQSQKISIQDLGAHQAILTASLRDTVGPRLAFLQSVAVHQQGFVFADQLTEVANLSDAAFADMYDMPSTGLAYTHDFVHAWQQAQAML